MPLPLHRAQAVTRLAQRLYDYLPASGASYWRGHVSFGSIAQQQGVGEFWQGGSKLPAITRLLELTLERRPDRFQPLILAVVREGLRYRRRTGQPLLRRDIEQINELIADVGFKYPELWSAQFLDMLPYSPPSESAEQAAPASTATESAATLEDLKLRLITLHKQANRQAAGLALEKLLTDLFALADLAPRGSFRVIGEQIDGSFVLDGQIYLLEAKWEATPVGEDELLVFSGKVAGKSTFTRGLFVSLSGFSSPGLNAITRGKQPNSVLMDGADHWQVLESRVALDDLVRAKVRRLGEEGRVFVPARELLG